MARAYRVASLSGDLFWSLTPAEIDGIICEALDEWRARERAAAYNAAMICASLYNCHRDSKTHPDPFTPDDFLPRIEKPKPPTPPEVLTQKANMAMGILQTLNP